MPATSKRIRAFPFALLFGTLLSSPSLADEVCPDGNLLAGRLPLRPAGILHAERLTDGIAASEGDDWQVDLVATVRSDATLVYDLGRSVRVRSAFLQGDYRGSYFIQGSANGRDWFELWNTPANDAPGLRSRTTSGLDGVVRFLRVVDPRPRGQAFGLTDIQVSCSRQDTWPTVTIRAGATDLTPGALRERYRQQQAIHRLDVGLLGGVAFLAMFLVTRRQKPPPGFWPCLGGAVLVLVYAAARIRSQPVDAERWLQLAGVAAAAFAVALAASCVLPARRGVRDERILDPRAGAAVAIGSLGAGIYALVTGVIYGALHWAVPLTTVVLTGAAAVLLRGSRRSVFARYVPLAYVTLAGALCATNFGTFFQWREVVAGVGADAALNPATTWGLVLYHDQFHYYLGSKYFPELGYHGLYDCTALAELENGREAEIEASRIRNLRDNKLEPGSLALQRAVECRRKFSTERWEAFRSDVDYFRTRVERAAAQRYLTDHGYNATPLWTAIGRVVASATTATDRSTRLLAALDIVFLAGCFVLIAWAFAPEAGALAALVWGVGHAWFYVHVGGLGSFARFDWLFAAVAGVCLLRKQLGALSGLALVVSTLLRIFPGALFFGPAVRGLQQLWRKRRLDAGLRALLVGTLVGFAVLVPVSLLGTDLGSYGEFAQNSKKHAETPLTNYMGLRTLFSWDPAARDRLVTERNLDDPDAFALVWKQQRQVTFGERRVWYVLTAAALIGLTVLVSLGASETWLITLAGVVPMFCLFELTNYYYAVMALFSVWAYRDLRHTAVLLALALGGTVVFLHWQWRAIAYVANSALVLGMLVYFLVSALLEKRSAAIPSSG